MKKKTYLVFASFFFIIFIYIIFSFLKFKKNSENIDSPTEVQNKTIIILCKSENKKNCLNLGREVGKSGLSVSMFFKKEDIEELEKNNNMYLSFDSNGFYCVNLTEDLLNDVLLVKKCTVIKS